MPPVQNNNGKVAYLTFDDGPSVTTPELLDVLDQCNVHGTFFVVGNQVQHYPSYLKQIAERGNAIGIHSWTHDYSYIYRNMDNYISDFSRLKDYIQQLTGTEPKICRFPGGTNNTVNYKYNKEHIMKKVAEYALSNGYRYFDWNVSTGEATINPPSKEAIINNVITQSKHRKTVIILCHETTNMDFVEAIPEIVSQLRDMGFTFDTLTQSSPVIQFNPS
jgi:peptidoglycan/xylan/chitin deacetylase (PgdA/CDA1 family)